MAADNPADPEQWLAEASKQRGTWWDDWVQWLGQRSGSERAAPKRVGAKGFKPLGKAPGEYVHG